MRNAIVQMPAQQSAQEQRQVLRAAIRQLERADVYLAAIVHTELEDWEADRSLRRIRGEVEQLRRYLVGIRIEG
jgi:hypothetical protein